MLIPRARTVDSPKQVHHYDGTWFEKLFYILVSSGNGFMLHFYATGSTVIVATACISDKIKYMLDIHSITLANATVSNCSQLQWHSVVITNIYWHSVLHFAINHHHMLSYKCSIAVYRAVIVLYCSARAVIIIIAYWGRLQVKNYDK